jgi:hypothetical protein
MSAKRASIRDRSPLDALFDKQGKPTPAQGRAGTHEDAPAETLRQTTIMVYDRHLNWLDEQCIAARTNGGKAIRKAVLIRALIDLARSAPVDLRGLEREEDLVVRFEAAIKAKEE